MDTALTLLGGWISAYQVRCTCNYIHVTETAKIILIVLNVEFLLNQTSSIYAMEITCGENVLIKKETMKEQSTALITAM